MTNVSKYKTVNVVAVIEVTLSCCFYIDLLVTNGATRVYYEK